MVRPVNLARYEEKDWDYLLSVISDRESMHDSWDDWHKEYKKVKATLASQGFYVREVSINIEELVHYCQERKIKIDGKARAQFVQTK